MGIPVATTTITVAVPDAGTTTGDPYEPRTYTQVATGVRAVIDTPTSGAHGGKETVAGGQQTTTQLRLFADPCPITRLARVTDERNGRVYEVVWLQIYDDPSMGLEHIQGELEIVEGLK